MQLRFTIIFKYISVTAEIYNCPETEHGTGYTSCAFSPDCPDGQWGPDCQNSCEPCANGGQCNRETGACDCPPGYTGPSCSASKSLPQPSLRTESQIENSGYGLISALLLFCEIKHADLRLSALHLQEFPRLDLTLFVGGRLQIKARDQLSCIPNGCYH